MPRYRPRKPRVAKPPAIAERERLDYAWKHFALLADQRIKNFNFYVLVLLAAFGGTITSMPLRLPETDYRMIGMMNIFAALIFWALEARSCRLLDIPIAALLEIERSPAFEGKAKLLLNDQTTKTRLQRAISYRGAFRAAFLAQIIFGSFLAFGPSLFLPVPLNPEYHQAPAPPNRRIAPPSTKQKRWSYGLDWVVVADCFLIPP